MRTVVVIQARVQSTRLPAKVLLDLGGVTALERCLCRARRIRGVDDVVIATSAEPADDLIERVAKRLECAVVRGSETDVLSRFLLVEADVIVRLTSDCPLLDPEESSRVVDAFMQAKPDYASNVLERSLPRGLDTEIVTRAALERAARDATREEREHVTLHVVRHPEAFRHVSITSKVDLSHHRWTLDTLDDYRMLHALFARLPDPANATTADVVRVLEAHPEISAINHHVEQKKTSERVAAGDRGK